MKVVFIISSSLQTFHSQFDSSFILIDCEDRSVEEVFFLVLNSLSDGVWMEAGEDARIWRLHDATNLKELPEIVDLTERHRHQYQGLKERPKDDS